MLKHTFNIIIFILIIQCIAFAQVEIFLFSNAVYNDGNLELGDIAKISSDSDDVKLIQSLIISKEIYSDQYIDKLEITSLLQKTIKENFFIYGNAVKVKQEDESYSQYEKHTEKNSHKNPIVKRGDIVILIVRNRGISLECKGRVLQNGCLGDEITVRLHTGSKNRKSLVKGRVHKKGVVEVIL